MKKKDIFRKSADLSDNGEAFVLITVIEKHGSCPSDTGGRMICMHNGETYGTIGGGTLEKVAVGESEKILISRESFSRKYNLNNNEVISKSETTGMLCGGEVTLFYEYVGVDETVFIFGAGHIGKKLIYFLKELMYQVIMIDDRGKVLESVNGVRKVFFNDIDDIYDNIGSLSGNYVVIASHSHELDYKILKSILTNGFVPKYLGVVASKKKIETMIIRLKKEIGNTPNLDTLSSPAGLDIGGRTPAEIALSIVSEIQSVKYERKIIKSLSNDFLSKK